MSGRDIDFCWWCGINPAKTREHRIKQSRLSSATSIEGPLTLFSYGYRPHALRSTDAKAIKFGKTLCQSCNSSRSQPFDVSYDIFVEWAQSRRELLQSEDSIDWQTVFEDSPYDFRYLARYYVKNLCCRIVDSGLSVPPSLVSFLDDIESSAPLTFIFYKDYSCEMRSTEGDILDIFSSRTSQAVGPVDSSSNEPDSFWTLVEDGFFGVIVVYTHPKHETLEPIYSANQKSSRLFDAQHDLKFATPLFREKRILDIAYKKQMKLGRDLTEKERNELVYSFNSKTEFIYPRYQPSKTKILLFLLRALTYRIKNRLFNQ